MLRQNPPPAPRRKKKDGASGENIMALTVFGLSALTKGAFGAISGERNITYVTYERRRRWRHKSAVGAMSANWLNEGAVGATKAPLALQS